MAEYVNIRIRKDTYERLKELSAGVPLVRFLDDACRHWSQDSKDEADALLEQLDKKSEEYHIDPLLEGLGPDELPECCQAFLKSEGYENCGHWEDRRPTGYLNKLTHKWSSDPSYYQYL